MPDSCVLLSDFELWHFVLNYWYLPSSEADAEAFDLRYPHRSSWADPPANAQLDAAIQGSWHRIFDIDWHDPYAAASREQKSIQGTFWQLETSWITNVDEFVAR